MVSKKVRIKKLRAHHVRDVFFDYLRIGEIPEIHMRIKDYKFLLAFPLLVVNTTDDYCEKCLGYPAMNFCAGPKVREEDELDARILGLRIDKEYTKDELTRLFERNSRRTVSLQRKLRIGHYSYDDIVGRFRKLKPIR